MIEPYISDKQCTKCGECKPETQFPKRHDRAGKRRSVCASCTYIRSQQYPSRSGVPAQEQPAPLPATTLLEQLDCVRLRKWAPNVDRNRPLRATIGGLA